MFTIYRRVFDLLQPWERRRSWLLCLMILSMGVFELLGVASILPFLAVLSNPAVVETRPVLAAIYTGLGFTSVHQFLGHL